MTEPGTPLLDWLVAALLVGGAAFALLGSIGLVKLDDFYRRLHGPTKATTLGVGGVLLASSLHFSQASGQPSLRELLLVAFLFATAPVGAQLLAKSALAEDPEAPRPPAQPPRQGGARDGRTDGRAGHGDGDGDGDGEGPDGAD